jgi:hypothetical protein
VHRRSPSLLPRVDQARTMVAGWWRGPARAASAPRSGRREQGIPRAATDDTPSSGGSRARSPATGRSTMVSSRQMESSRSATGAGGG